MAKAYHPCMASTCAVIRVADAVQSPLTGSNRQRGQAPKCHGKCRWPPTDRRRYPDMSEWRAETERSGSKVDIRMGEREEKVTLLPGGDWPMR